MKLRLRIPKNREQKLITVFDFLTVGCFVCVVVSFFLFTERSLRTLAHLLLCGVAFALANQLGNSGSTILAVILTVAGGFYAVFVVREYGLPPR
jgi:hypothetical protein